MLKPKPNILHLFTDQQRFDTIAALGHSCIKTPNIDRLVKEGTVFTRAYSPSPECVPARASMITGRYPPGNECYCNEQPMPPEDTVTYMRVLSENGYNTQGIGKCHFTPDVHSLRGFQARLSQEELVFEREADDYAKWLIEEGYDWVIEPHGVRGEMYYIPQVSALPPEAHPTRWIGDRTIEFIEGSGEQPWYCFSSFIHPHPPFAPPIPKHKNYRAPDMPLPDLPDGREDLLTFINHYQNRYKYRDRGLDINLVRCIRAYYFACIEFIDEQVGRIFDALDSTGQLENTLIVFSSDHGEYLGDYGCFGKRGMHDVSARIPMLVRWPGGDRANTRCDRAVSLVDLAPTFLDVAGIHYQPDRFDGVSLQTIFESEGEREYVYSQYGRAENGLYMIASDKWKYVFSAPDQKEYLFDLRKDPKEHRNLAAVSIFEEQLLKLRVYCQSWVRDQGEHSAIDVDGWRLYPKRTLSSNPDEGLIYQDPRWWSEARKSPDT